MPSGMELEAKKDDKLCSYGVQLVETQAILSVLMAVDSNKFYRRRLSKFSVKQGRTDITIPLQGQF
jgi:hypothetical protein